MLPPIGPPKGSPQGHQGFQSRSPADNFQCGHFSKTKDSSKLSSRSGSNDRIATKCSRGRFEGKTSSSASGLGKRGLARGENVGVKSIFILI